LGSGLPPAGRRHVAAGIVVPVVLSLVAMAATVGGFVLWSTGNSDARAVQRQAALIDHAMRGYFTQQIANQESWTIWDETVARTSTNFDPDWIDENLGTEFYESYGYEQTAVLDGDDRPVYLMQDGHAVKPAFLEPDMAGIMPLVARLRGEIAAGALRAYLGGARANMPSAQDYVVIAGTPAMVTVAPIADTATNPERPFLHVAIDFLDEDYARYVGESNLVDDASFRTTASGDPESATLPLLNNAGRIIAFLEWRQDWPGKRLLSETAPVLGGALLLAGILILILLDRLWRYSSELDAGRIKAEHQANHDPLTGLANRAGFEAQLARHAADERRHGYLALFMLDLDRFKQVNDTLGHPAGDHLIRCVGGRLANAVSGPGMIARLGGDEFAIIEPSLSGPAEAQALAQRLIEIIGQPFEIFGNEASVGVSIGIGLVADATTSPVELVRRADIALYEAKAGGRNRAMVYDAGMDVAVHQRHSIEAELREALRSPDQVGVMFEPIIDAMTGETVGAQALPFWQHPQMGGVPRDLFVSVAEGCGLSEPLGERVLRAACRMGANHSGRVISVGVSPAQIRSPKFFSRVFDILAETGMRPGNLEIEITERVLLGDPEGAGEVLRKFRAAGIRIALDDFGTGYSSLNFLKQYDVDHIRIDRAFAQDANEDRSALAMVEAMVGLAHAMNITVTAKGIDTILQENRFAGIGCDRLQGAFVSRPVSVEAMEAILAGGTGTEARPDAA